MKYVALNELFIKISALAGLFLIPMVLYSSMCRADNFSKLRRSIFKVTVTSQASNFIEPWKKNRPSHSNGSGFYIGNGRVMTNAHVVADATYITLQRDGEARAERAYVEYIGHDCDLAILRVFDRGAPSIETTEEPDPSDNDISDYFEGTTALSFGSIPHLRSPVMTMGFPTGGEEISITQGVVSRIDYRRYVHDGSSEHVLVQVDSAINPGNSGGPILQYGKVVGVAFQSYTNAENTGYMIPVPVIKRFLKDIEDGAYAGHPRDGLSTLPWATTNPATMAFHQLKKEEGGIKVVHVARWSPFHEKIIPGDVILTIDDQAIASDGKIAFASERIDFRALIDLKQIGDLVRLSLIRGRERKVLSVEVKAAQKAYQPKYSYAMRPRYVTYGGLVFTAMNRSFLKSWGSKWYYHAPFYLRYLDAVYNFDPDFKDKEDIIVLSTRLPSAVNREMHGALFQVLKALNGHPISSLDQLQKLLTHVKDDFIVFSFYDSESVLALARKQVVAENPSIHAKYKVNPSFWLQGETLDGAIGKE